MNRNFDLSLPTLDDVMVAQLRVVIREDFNVPLDENGHITDDARIRAAIPTLQAVLGQQAGVILLSHLGRPQEGCSDKCLSLQPVADRLSELLQQPVPLVRDYLSGIEVAPGQVVLCENVRFLTGEKENDPNLARALANLGDLFVMDAFGTSHRAHASTVGVAQYATQACAGPLLVRELQALTQALHRERAPLLAVIGGAKVTSKLDVIMALMVKAQAIILGGGIANTFLAAQGSPVGASLFEPDLVATAKTCLQEAQRLECDLLLPQDVVVAASWDEPSKSRLVAIDAVQASDKIFDIGPATQARYHQAALAAGTILWNGPIGVFEREAFAAGTAALARSIADSTAFSVAGGGDTLAAVAKFKVDRKISYLSTGGGAFLRFVEGATLPGLAILQQRHSQKQDALSGSES